MNELLLTVLGNEMKMTLSGIGSLAFFAAVYLSVKHPELVESPGQVKQELAEHPLRKWVNVIS
jgi:hypothetical protein